MSHSSSGQLINSLMSPREGAWLGKWRAEPGEAVSLLWDAPSFPWREARWLFHPWWWLRRACWTWWSPCYVLLKAWNENDHCYSQGHSSKPCALPGRERAEACWGRGRLRHPLLRPWCKARYGGSCAGGSRKGLCRGPVETWTFIVFPWLKHKIITNKQNCQLGVCHWSIFIKELLDSQLESSWCGGKNIKWGSNPFFPTN